MTRAIVLAFIGWLAATGTAVAQSSEKDILDAKNACRERVETVDKNVVLKWWFERATQMMEQAGVKHERTTEESIQEIAGKTEVSSHWSLQLHTCLAILETDWGVAGTNDSKTLVDRRSWGSIVLDIIEMRIVADVASVWLLDNKRMFLGNLYVPTKTALTEEDYRKLITQ